jgi:hypothetical protein
MFVCRGLDQLAPLFLWIGDGDELTVLLLEETIQDLSTSRAKPDTAHDNPVAGSDASIFTEGAGRYNGGHADGGNGSGFQKGAASRF